MTAKELDLMRHACGMDSRDPYYRDYFAAEPGSEDDEVWRGLVAQGLALVRIEPNSKRNLSTLRIYGVTKAGKAALGKPDAPGQWEVWG